MSDDDVTLTEMEARRLAHRLLVRHLSDGDWLNWEDVPLLTESAWSLVEAQAEDIVADIRARADGLDRAQDIDSQLLWEQTQ